MKKNQKPNEEQLKYLKQVSEDLESMILGSDLPAVQEAAKADLPSASTIRPLNYDEIKRDADTKAEQIVESAVLLYLPKEFVFEQDYVTQKMSVDKMTVSNLIFQMKTAEHAIKKLLEDIDSGNTHPRAFEVLASLQKSKMEIVKHLAQFMVVLETNYKNLKIDYESNVPEKTHVQDLEAEEIREESTRFRGTRGLMSTIQTYIQEASRTPANDGYQDMESKDNDV
jgi:hypothetical protein